jgi:hypothetical protein
VQWRSFSTEDPILERDSHRDLWRVCGVRGGSTPVRRVSKNTLWKGGIQGPTKKVEFVPVSAYHGSTQQENRTVGGGFGTVTPKENGGGQMKKGALFIVLLAVVLAMTLGMQACKKKAEEVAQQEQAPPAEQAAAPAKEVIRITCWAGYAESFAEDFKALVKE